MLLPWVCLSARRSITSRRSLEMAKHIFTKTTPHNSLFIFWCQKYLGEIPVMLSQKQMAPNASGVGKISNFWNVTYMPTSQPESPERGLQSSPPACTASVTVGSSKAPWPWLWPWIGSRSHQHTQYVRVGLPAYPTVYWNAVPKYGHLNFVKYRHLAKSKLSW